MARGASARVRNMRASGAANEGRVACAARVADIGAARTRRADALPCATARAGIARTRAKEPAAVDHVRGFVGARHRQRALRLASDAVGWLAHGSAAPARGSW